MLIASKKERDEASGERAQKVEERHRASMETGAWFRRANRSHFDLHTRAGGLCSTTWPFL